MSNSDNSINPAFITFESPKDQSAFIKVLGVGGGGCNAVNHMYNEGIKGVDFIVCNTDAKALNSSPVPNKISLAKLGAGNNPAVGKAAAEKKADEIREILSHNTQMLFITAGMGGGTGTGAAPVIAEIAKSIDLDNEAAPKILVVAIVTMPFMFEGNKRRIQAENGIKELSKYVDSILVINNDKLRSYGDKTLGNAFALADDVLLTAAKGISEIITVDAYINIDFQDVNAVMQNSGTALMGAGEARGEGRALQAIEAASTSVLLNDNDIKGAKDVLLYLSFSPDHEITMDEMTACAAFLTSRTDNADCNVIWGYGADESITDDTFKVTLIATGFEKKERLDLPPVSNPHTLPLEEPIKETPAQAEASTAEIHIKRQTETTAETAAPAAGTVVRSEPSAPFEDDQPACVEPMDSIAPKVVHRLEEEPVQEAETAVEDAAAEFNPEDEIQVRSVEAHATDPIRLEDPSQLVESQQDLQRITSKAERIREMLHRLKNDPDAPAAFENLTTEELSGETIPLTSHSSKREAAATVLTAAGRIAANSYIEDLPD